MGRSSLKDPAMARSFYTAVFGFRHDELPMPSPMDYQTFSHADGEMPLGGMGEMFDAPDSVPSHWVVYFQVEDTPAAVELIKAEGGETITEIMPTPFGRQVTVSDPFGAVFNIIDNHTA